MTTTATDTTTDLTNHRLDVERVNGRHGHPLFFLDLGPDLRDRAASAEVIGLSKTNPWFSTTTATDNDNDMQRRSQRECEQSGAAGNTFSHDIRGQDRTR